eukprot:3957904-Heterocapsa_arctica.AAC.1
MDQLGHEGQEGARGRSRVMVKRKTIFMRGAASASSDSRCICRGCGLVLHQVHAVVHLLQAFLDTPAKVLNIIVLGLQCGGDFLVLGLQLGSELLVEGIELGGELQVDRVHLGEELSLLQ